MIARHEELHRATRDQEPPAGKPVDGGGIRNRDRIQGTHSSDFVVDRTQVVLEFREGEPVAAGGGVAGDAKHFADGIEGGVFPEMEMDDGALLQGENQERTGQSLIEKRGIRINGRGEERLGFGVPTGFPVGDGFPPAQKIEDQPMR